MNNVSCKDFIPHFIYEFSIIGDFIFDIILRLVTKQLSISLYSMADVQSVACSARPAWLWPFTIKVKLILFLKLTKLRARKLEI